MNSTRDPILTRSPERSSTARHQPGEARVAAPSPATQPLPRFAQLGLRTGETAGGTPGLLERVPHPTGHLGLRAAIPPRRLSEGWVISQEVPVGTHLSPYRCPHAQPCLFVGAVSAL